MKNQDPHSTLPTKFSPKIIDDYPEVYKQFLEFKGYISKLTSYDSLPLAVSYPNNPKICYQSFPEIEPEGHVTPYYFEHVGSVGDLWRVFSILYVRNTVKGMCNSIAVNEFFNERRARAEVSRIRAFVVDIDSFVGEEDFKRLKASVPEPSFVVRSSWKKGEGSKFHLYWLVRAPEKGNDYEEGFSRRLVGKYEEINKALAYKVEGVGQSLGLTVVADKSIGSEKVLRAPGFYHQKNGERDFLVRLENSQDVVIACSKKSIDSFLLEFGIDKEFLAWAEKQQSERHERLRSKSAKQVSLLKNARLVQHGGEVNNELVASYYTKDEVEVGERNESLFFIVGDMLKRGLSYEECLGGALVYNEGLENPLPPEEVERLVISRIKHWHQTYKLDNEKLLKRKLRSKELVEEKEEQNKPANKALKQPIEVSSGSEDAPNPIPFPTLSAKELGYNYKLGKHNPFLNPLSEISIAERTRQKLPSEVYVCGDRFFLYNDRKGKFEKDQVSENMLSDTVKHVVSNMLFEEYVQNQFIKINKKTKEVKFDEEGLKKFVSINQNATKVEHTIKQLAQNPDIVKDINDFEPHDNLFLTRACVLELKENGSAATKKFNPEYLMLHKTEVKFNEQVYEQELKLIEKEETGSSLWHKFLLDVMDGDLELIRYLQRVIGYSLIASIEKQAIFFLTGPASTGKSTFLETISAMFGEYSDSIPIETISRDKFKSAPSNFALSSLAALTGKRFVITEETDKDFYLATNVLKDFTAKRQGINAKRMRQDPIKVYPKCSLFIQGNYTPKFDGTDEAVWRRLNYLPFLRVFKGSDMDTSLGSKLTSEESLEHVFAWAVAGFREYARLGLQAPKSCQHFKEDIQRERSLLGWFLEPDVYFEELTQEEINQMLVSKDGGINATDLWRMYNKAHNQALPECGKIETVHSFGRELINHGIKKYRHRTLGICYALKLKPIDSKVVGLKPWLLNQE